LPANNYEALLEALYSEGPIVVNVDASSWHSYTRGVFDGCDTANPDVNHVVVLVGYGIDSKLGPYWTIRNSWGPGWGEGGHIRIKRTV
jgi:C1A family cysteine protease